MMQKNNCDYSSSGPILSGIVTYIYQRELQSNKANTLDKEIFKPASTTMQ